MRDYLAALQEEYVIAELRKKIYPNIKDRNYYSRVMDAKRKKIENISDRNSLPSIFSDTRILGVYQDKVYTWGIPFFKYRNEDHRNESWKFDMANYYSKGADIRIKDSDGEKDAVIVNSRTLEDVLFRGNGEVDESKMGVKVKVSEETFLVLLENIRRIL